jgi:hypothetical protein
MASFAVAALVVAILFSDRLGPPEELKRRFYQVGLGVAVAILVGAVAAVIVPVPNDVTQSLSLGSNDEAGTGILRERLSVVVGIALLLLLGSLYQSKTFPTMSVGIMLGALVLIISSVADAGSAGFLGFYYELTLDGGQARNAVYVAVTAVGILLLLMYGFGEWDRARIETEDEKVDEA